jgi:hypothetical protein
LVLKKKANFFDENWEKSQKNPNLGIFWRALEW